MVLISFLRTVWFIALGTNILLGASDLRRPLLSDDVYGAVCAQTEEAHKLSVALSLEQEEMLFKAGEALQQAAAALENRDKAVDVGRCDSLVRDLRSEIGTAGVDADSPYFLIVQIIDSYLHQRHQGVGEEDDSSKNPLYDSKSDGLTPLPRLPALPVQAPAQPARRFCCVQ